MVAPVLATASVKTDSDTSVSDKSVSDKSGSDKSANANESVVATTTLASKPLERPPAGLAYAFATYRVYATQFEPSVPGSVEVAVPDKCVKFAALRSTATLAALKCPASYSLERDYRLVVTRDDGQSGIVPVKEAGPWNIDDNWWAGRRLDEPRRLFPDLPAGRPEAQVASSSAYNTVADCKDLAGKPTGKSGGADQFGRCVLNPAGIDLSVAAAKALGFGPLENAWVNVTLLWEPVEISITNAVSNKSLDVRDSLTAEGAPVVQGTYVGVANQHWRLRPVSGNVYTITAGHSAKLLSVRDRSTADGAATNQQAPTGATNQQWRLEALGPASPVQG
ncbi:MAG: RICIN domain-containing protein, partial [Pseudonocardiaceae bacterium]